VSKPADRRRLGPWLDLLALTAQDPTTPWASVLLTAPASGSTKAFALETIEIPLPDADDRQHRALTALEVVVDLFRRGQREPLPLFPMLSPALHKGNKAANAWVSNDYARRDDADRWIRMAFDHADVDRITSLPTRPDDPVGPGYDRASRFAHRLWGALEASLRGPDKGDPS
jgi:exodeoxyribonuclease V gamma subunit